jgi:hypothetical protein
MDIKEFQNILTIKQNIRFAETYLTIKINIINQNSIVYIVNI